jgi:RNA polymerase sigma-70 factor (ECF subfamily)
MDDIMIINLYWERSESAISETANKYGDYCTKIAMNILHNKEDSDECVNDTYFKTWNAIPEQRPTLLMSFLGRITRNLSLDKYKERRTQKRGGGEVELLLDELENCVPSGSNVEEEYETGLIAKTIDNFLDSINSESRVVFVRRYWYADSVESIAERFSMSESKVKSMLFRTRNKFKLYLEKEGVNI